MKSKRCSSVTESQPTSLRRSILGNRSERMLKFAQCVASSLVRDVKFGMSRHSRVTREPASPRYLFASMNKGNRRKRGE